MKKGTWKAFVVVTTSYINRKHVVICIEHPSRGTTGISLSGVTLSVTARRRFYHC